MAKRALARGGVDRNEVRLEQGERALNRRLARDPPVEETQAVDPGPNRLRIGGGHPPFDRRQQARERRGRHALPICLRSRDRLAALGHQRWRPCTGERAVLADHFLQRTRDPQVDEAATRLGEMTICAAAHQVVGEVMTIRLGPDQPASLELERARQQLAPRSLDHPLEEREAEAAAERGGPEHEIRGGRGEVLQTLCDEPVEPVGGDRSLVRQRARPRARTEGGPRSRSTRSRRRPADRPSVPARSSRRDRAARARTSCGRRR